MAGPRLLTALIAAMVGFGSLPADSPQHFEGPYHVVVEPFQRVRATVTSTFRFVDLEAHEWWAAFPSPPEFEGQPSARVQVRIVEAAAGGGGADHRRECDASPWSRCTGFRKATTPRAP